MLQKWQNVNEFHKGLQYKKTLHVNVHMYQQQYIITIFLPMKIEHFSFQYKKTSFQARRKPSQMKKSCYKCLEIWGCLVMKRVWLIHASKHVLWII